MELRGETRAGERVRRCGRWREVIDLTYLPRMALAPTVPLRPSAREVIHLTDSPHTARDPAPQRMGCYDDFMQFKRRIERNAADPAAEMAEHDILYNHFQDMRQEDLLR
jgi:hypothetical protein